jgi:hypothetical protein
MSNRHLIYEARVGKVGQVAFYKDPKTLTYCFYFYNGKEYTPLYLSEEAAYYVWAFIGCEHPEATVTPRVGIAHSKALNKISSAPKKAGRGKIKRNQPSNKVKKVKGKSYGKV